MTICAEKKVRHPSRVKQAAICLPLSQQSALPDLKYVELREATNTSTS